MRNYDDEKPDVFSGLSGCKEVLNYDTNYICDLYIRFLHIFFRFHELLLCTQKGEKRINEKKTFFFQLEGYFEFHELLTFFFEPTESFTFFLQIKSHYADF